MGKVLIVDDDAEFAETLATLCRSWGHAATVVHSADAALLELDDEIFDFALIDNVMPQKNGLELIGDMRRNHFQLPVAVCTGYQTKDLEERMSGLRISEIFSKPLDYKRFQQLLHDSMRGPVN